MLSTNALESCVRERAVRAVPVPELRFAVEEKFRKSAHFMEHVWTSRLGEGLSEKGKYEEAKVFYLAALEGQRRVLGDEHKNTLASLHNMGRLLYSMEDYEGALAYNQQALGAQEKELGKTHPSTLTTIMNMAITYQVGLKDFVKAEEMLRLALNGYERSLGKGHETTKRCARNLAILYVDCLQS